MKLSSHPRLLCWCCYWIASCLPSLSCALLFSLFQWFLKIQSVDIHNRKMLSTCLTCQLCGARRKESFPAIDLRSTESKTEQPPLDVCHDVKVSIGLWFPDIFPLSQSITVVEEYYVPKDILWYILCDMKRRREEWNERRGSPSINLLLELYRSWIKVKYWEKWFYNY